VPVEEPSTASLAEVGLEWLSSPAALDADLWRVSVGHGRPDTFWTVCRHANVAPGIGPGVQIVQVESWGAVSIYHLLDLTADSNLIPTDVSEDNGRLENIMNGMSAPQRRRRW
jgi:hypothetical protein